MIPEDFHLENRYYYSRLNTGEKDFYKFLVELYLKRERKYTFAWKGDFIPDIPEVQALPSFVWGGYGEFVDFTKVHEAVNYDCPEFFYFCQCSHCFRACFVYNNVTKLRLFCEEIKFVVKIL